ncbi:GNAT family N-acetyltransferase [Bacillus ginsengihumi]|mgnify:CR=1 FL=1|uniref:GNAT family N-acetyltransferase n=1 Tax=Heyndrickxia ginsengihumi TaxID=363870 RepID=A0A6M0P6B2_9BACI|nr:GNAT family N-acetyltransferase [Heyndrickxia ginsengihumi]MBE6184382.1 GNAT family N-acetyltransferase [Bacillus sp. (in: firmicutes)]MCM3024444.1 GNAT family N-acetyltransferase [Heyndrickxia ginsengihumi]NEY20252.1 GNAT family N-acetyltransferase [Heyndrickxia ginsengihumi]
MEIRRDDLTGQKVKELVAEHLGGMAQHSPPESIHALNLDELQKPEITFWCAWEEDDLLGCGALKELNDDHGEIKSMRTTSEHLRKGVATQMLKHIIDEANRRGYKRLSLETGAVEAFTPARNLYKHFGFQFCKPFADYKEDPNSVFMTKSLQL